MQLLVNIDVDDLDRAIDFYSAAFELRVGRRFGAGGVEMLGHSAPFYLLLKAGGSQAAPTMRQQRSYQRHWTPVHLDFHVDDLQAALARALAAGALQEQIFVNPEHGSVAFCSDPFGHGFCLIERKR